MNKILIALVLAVVMSGNAYANSNQKKISKNYLCDEFRIGFSFTVTKNEITKKVKTSSMKFVEINDRYDYLLNGESDVIITTSYYEWSVKTKEDPREKLQRYTTFFIDRVTGQIYIYKIEDRYKQDCKEYESFDDIKKILKNRLDDILNKNLL